MQNAFLNAVPKSLVQRLSQIDPIVAYRHLAMDWVVMIAAMWACNQYWHPVLYVITVMLIGNRQHSLAIQMHDSSHYRLDSNKRVNEWVGELLCAWPLFFRMQAYRINHLQHHTFTNTEQDPDFRRERFPTSRKEILWSLLLDVTGINTIEQLGELKRLKRGKVSGKTIAARIAYYSVAAALLTYFHAWNFFWLYWIVPAFTWLKVILRLRAIADHAGVHNEEYPFDTRTVVPNLFDRIFLAPRQCSYHLGHHLYQSIPSYNLKTLHHALMENKEFAARARVTHGFWRLLLEFPWNEPKESKTTKSRGRTPRAKQRLKLSSVVVKGRRKAQNE